MRVGALLRFAWVIAFLLPVARCGTPNAYPADADADAPASPKPCSTYSDCPAGYGCFFRISEGCTAKNGVCLAGKPGNCPQNWCSCAWWSSAPMCGPPGYVTTPVVSLDGEVCPTECSGLACELCDVSGYTPATMSAPTATANACTSAQITDASTACFGGSATQQTCQAWQTANAPDAGGGNCRDCLFTLRSSTAWGALVCDPTSCSVNTPGCVDLVLGQKTQEKVAGGTGSCGDILSDAEGCQNYACGTCSQTGGASSDYSTCLNATLNALCKSYGDRFYTDPACAALQGDAAPPKALSCFPQSDADVPKLLDVFCGTGP